MHPSMSEPSSREAVCRRLQAPDHWPNKTLPSNLGFLESPIRCRQVTSYHVSLVTSSELMNDSYNQDANGHVPSPQHPKRPGREPAVSFQGSQWQTLVFEK